MSRWNSLKIFLNRLFQRRNDVSGVACIGDIVKVFFTRGEIVDVPWRDIKQIIVQQNDMLTYEEISLYVTHGDGGEFRVDELMPEFHTFCEALDLAFPGFLRVFESYQESAIGRWSEIEALRVPLKFGEAVIVPVALEPNT